MYDKEREITIDMISSTEILRGFSSIGRYQNIIRDKSTIPTPRLIKGTSKQQTFQRVSNFIYVDDMCCYVALIKVVANREEASNFHSQQQKCIDLLDLYTTIPHDEGKDMYDSYGGTIAIPVAILVWSNTTIEETEHEIIILVHFSTDTLGHCFCNLSMIGAHDKRSIYEEVYNCQESASLLSDTEITYFHLYPIVKERNIDGQSVVRIPTAHQYQEQINMEALIAECNKHKEAITPTKHNQRTIYLSKRRKIYLKKCIEATKGLISETDEKYIHTLCTHIFNTFSTTNEWGELFKGRNTSINFLEVLISRLISS